MLGPMEGRIGATLLLLFIGVVILGPTIAPYSPTEIGVGLPDTGPSGNHWLGCDSLGRDILSRLLYGGRSVIAIPLAATVLAFLIGGALGMVAGYRAGRVDRVVSVIVDTALAIPSLLLVLVIITSLGGDSEVIVLSLGLVGAPRVARILRGATQGVATGEYIQAAQARGERTPWIVLHEIRPNIAATAFVEFAVRLSYGIILVSTLNFLGVGAQPPSPNWGLMVAESQETLVTTPIATLAPAFAIGLLSIAISLLADAVTQSCRVPGAEEYAR